MVCLCLKLQCFQEFYYLDILLLYVTLSQTNFVTVIKDFPQGPLKSRWIQQAKLTPGDTSSDHSFRSALSWIENCISTHPRCGAGTERPLPSRILELDRRDSASDEVRLLVTSDEFARYACLSYCWGKDQVFPKTTIENLEERCKGILVSALPATIRDAIAFTRKLGLRYLWVDCLCIVQNDPLDWRRESAQMANIYQNSYITLAAAMSADAQGGLFSCASPDNVAHLFTHTDSRGTSNEVYTRWSVPHNYFWNDTGIDQNWGDSDQLPLFHRGWAFQERLLAPRVLSFRSNELVMECMTENVCECSFADDNPGFPKAVFADTLENLETGSENAIDKWAKLAEEYSEMVLTFGSDKLPAISGIAKFIQQRTNATYLAGLWSERLLPNLCWSVESLEKRPLEWRAPSWTWASVDAAISFHAGLAYLEPDVSIIGYHCQTADGDSTGAVTSGFIAVSGTLHDEFKLSMDTIGIVREPEAFGFDSKDDLESFLGDTCAPLFWIRLLRPDPDEKSYCLILKETKIDIRNVPRFKINDTMSRDGTRIKGVHPYAMERVGLCVIHDTVNDGYRAIIKGKYPNIMSGNKKTIVII